VLQAIYYQDKLLAANKIGQQTIWGLAKQPMRQKAIAMCVVEKVILEVLGQLVYESLPIAASDGVVQCLGILKHLLDARPQTVQFQCFLADADLA
jgi:hypothetical protein